MKRLILVLCSILVLAAGCKKQDSYTYSGIEAGTLGGGVFTSDNGTKMTVVGNEGKYDVSSTRRVLISYQTQPFTDPAHISIDLLGLLDAGILQPEHARSLPADPSGSPLEITDAWFSSEYLNILATFKGKDPEKHTFSAAYTADEKGLTLRIGHDGSQDETTGTKPLSIFLCVPMYEPVLSLDQAAQAAGQKPVRPVPVLLQWTSYTMEYLCSPLHGGCSSAGRASDCGSECRGFEPHHPPRSAPGVFRGRFFSLYLQKRLIAMKKLVVIDACIRGEESRTRRIAEPILEELAKRYEITRFDLTKMPMEPLTPETYAQRAAGIIPAWALEAARAIAEADRLVVVAPFWDMSFPAVVKVFFEHVSLYDVTFMDNGRTCVGKCKCEKVMYITTRGMNIPTGDAREQGSSYLHALSELWDLGTVLTVAAWNLDYAMPEELEEKIENTTRFGLRLASSF